jgi:DNA-binding transcriptional regulator YiaG
MPNIMGVLKQEIMRLARKETREQTSVLKKMSAQYRRDIAGLKRGMAKLQKQAAVMEKAVLKQAPVVTADAAEKVRFTAKGLASQRKRLGLSADDYAKLAGVSGLSIYKWEGGKVRPRQAQVVALAALRDIGKKEALARLAALKPRPAKAAKPVKKAKKK